ncbi:MAG: PIN domain-containing protein [Patescibacteria group bacterium]
MVKNKVFLDSSVIISSLLSTQGGSFYVVNTLNKDFVLQTSRYALKEIDRAVQTKFENQPQLLLGLALFLETSNLSILKDPTSKEKDICSKYISVKDAPILVSAIKHSDYLLTLDNEFFNEKVLTFANRKSLIILKPKEFIEKFIELKKSL